MLIVTDSTARLFQAASPALSVGGLPAIIALREHDSTARVILN